MSPTTQDLLLFDTVLDQDPLLRYGQFNGAPSAALHVDGGEDPVWVQEETFKMGIWRLGILHDEPEIASLSVNVGTFTVAVGRWCRTRVVVLTGRDPVGNTVTSVFPQCCWATAAAGFGNGLGS